LPVISKAQQSGLHSCALENGADDIPVYVSKECCVGIVTLFDKNNGVLERQKEHCTDIVFEMLLINTDEYCNNDMSGCTIDYDNFQCDNQFAQTSEENGGRLFVGGSGVHRFHQNFQVYPAQ
jgi:hypothetical protein